MHTARSVRRQLEHWKMVDLVFKKAVEEAGADVKVTLLLNRLLFEDRGSEFVDVFADYVLMKRLPISKASLDKLVHAANTVTHG